MSFTDLSELRPVSADGSGWTAQSPGGGKQTEWVSRTRLFFLCDSSVGTQ